MTLLIDPPNAPGHGRLWSHLASDTSYAELHAFARSLGIPDRGFDRDHYDIPAERYDAVVAAGAVPVSSRELIARLRAAGLRRRKADALGPRRPGASLVRPARLRPGDTVAVVSPAGPVPDARLDAGLAVLRGWGYEVRVMPHTRGSHPELPYLAGRDAARAQDLVAAWCDPDVRAVLCTRGGYGVQRILPLLDWPAMAAAGPRVLVGFSDVTALHQAVAGRLGLVTVHGPVVAALGDGDEPSRRRLHRLLSAPEEVSGLPLPEADVVVPGEATGVLVGGNLAVLAAGAGTPWSTPARGGVVVLEDVGEDPYRLDRLLTQLLASGWFDDVRGVVVGALTDCGPPATVRAVVADRLGRLGVPLLLGAPLGHHSPNLAVPLGVPATLVARADGPAELTWPAALT